MSKYVKIFVRIVYLKTHTYIYNKITFISKLKLDKTTNFLLLKSIIICVCLLKPRLQFKHYFGGNVQ